MQNAVLGFLVFSLIAPAVFAVKMGSKCFLLDKEGAQIEGIGLNEKYEIASVSKVMVSYWAVKKVGAGGRYKSTVYVHQVDRNLADVHIEGSKEPYTGHQMLQFLVGELNRQGIRKIRTLSFDENFKYKTDVRTDSLDKRFRDHLDSPTSSESISYLRNSLRNIHSNYASLKQLAKSVHGMNLPSLLSLTVQDFKFQTKDHFDQQSFEKAYVYRSAPLQVLLKEMNRNSNNYVANKIFESLGGADEFARFMKEELSLGQDSIEFVNGSGDRYEPSSEKYNKASCNAVVITVRALHHELHSQGKKIQDILAVAGGDSRDGLSTLTKGYSTSNTEQVLVAKTGTVGPGVSLAGVMSTEEGDYFFGMITRTSNSAAEWHQAHGMIRTELSNFLRKHKRDPVNYHAKSFLPFDSQSTLKEVEAEGSKMLVKP